MAKFNFYRRAVEAKFNNGELLWRHPLLHLQTGLLVDAAASSAWLPRRAAGEPAVSGRVARKLGMTQLISC